MHVTFEIVVNHVSGDTRETTKMSPADQSPIPEVGEPYGASVSNR